MVHQPPTAHRHRTPSSIIVQPDYKATLKRLGAAAAFETWRERDTAARGELCRKFIAAVQRVLAQDARELDKVNHPVLLAGLGCGHPMDLKKTATLTELRAFEAVFLNSGEPREMEMEENGLVVRRVTPLSEASRILIAREANMILAGTRGLGNNPPRQWYFDTIEEAFEATVSAFMEDILVLGKGESSRKALLDGVNRSKDHAERFSKDVLARLRGQALEGLKGESDASSKARGAAYAEIERLRFSAMADKDTVARYDPERGKIVYHRIGT